MNEYALLDARGEVFQIVTTLSDLRTMRERYPAYIVKPVEHVDRRILERYEFWGQRP